MTNHDPDHQALERLRNNLLEFNAIREELAATKQALSDLQGDVEFYRRELARVQSERDTYLVLSTRLCERVRLSGDAITEAAKIAVQFQAELSQRQMERESEADPSPLKLPENRLPEAQG